MKHGWVMNDAFKRVSIDPYSEERRGWIIEVAVDPTWSISGWWFGTFFLFFHNLWDNPCHWRFPSFFRGVGIPPTRFCWSSWPLLDIWEVGLVHVWRLTLGQKWVHGDTMGQNDIQLSGVDGHQQYNLDDFFFFYNDLIAMSSGFFLGATISPTDRTLEYTGFESVWNFGNPQNPNWKMKNMVGICWLQLHGPHEKSLSIEHWISYFCKIILVYTIQHACTIYIYHICM